MDTSGLPFPKGQPSVIAKQRRSVKRDRLIAQAYDAVNRRDGGRCRVTGVTLSGFSMDDKRRREHHHLRGRNVKPEWATQAKRIVLVSAYVHRLITANALVAHQRNADKPIQWSWNRNLVKKGKEPFRLNESET
jgi:hypothetical protein